MNPTSSVEIDQKDTVQKIYSYLMSHGSGLRNADAFACMISSYCTGIGAMPEWLGLEERQYTNLINQYYPGAMLPVYQSSPQKIQIDRMDEQDELYELLTVNRADAEPDTLWMARIVTTGCMGSNHLWQDLGLWERKDLTNLMNVSFPSLAKRNDKNMKWKKFLYKQLCQQEGIYTCRSPSCEVCADYNECFGPED